MSSTLAQKYLKVARAIYPRPGLIVFLFAVGFCGRLLFLLNTTVIGRWADALSKGGVEAGAVGHYLMLLLAFSFSGFALTALFRHFYCKATIEGVSRWHDQIMSRVSRFPTSFFERTKSGSVLNIFSHDYSAMLFLSGGPLSEMVLVVFDILAISLLMAYNSALSIPVMACFIAGNYLVWSRTSGNLRRLRQESAGLRARNLTFLLESLTGARIIRNFSKQNEFSERFGDMCETLKTPLMKTSAGQSLFALKVNLVSATVLLVVALGSAYLIQQGSLTVGEAGVALSLILYAGITIDYFFTYLANFGDAASSLDRLSVYAFDLPALDNRAAPAVPDGSALGIDFKDVWLSYSDNAQFALKGVSFTVRPGEKLGIIGRTGSGKSSIVQTIFGLYPVNKGSVAFFQQASAPLLQLDNRLGDACAAQPLIGYVSQDLFLFKGVLRENIDIEGKATDAALIQALRNVGLERFASPEGLRAPVGERGMNFSQGEKQLLAMARFFVEAKPIIIFDEPTSAIDPETEKIVQRAIENHFNGKTQIIISHKLSILHKCNRIIWLDQGQIRAQGEPQEVINIFTSEPANAQENLA